MREFLRSHDTSGWLFVNFDGVSADAPLRVLSREAGPAGSKPDPGLMEAARKVGERDPELAAEPLLDGSGLPYDATAVMAIMARVSRMSRRVCGRVGTAR